MLQLSPKPAKPEAPGKAFTPLTTHSDQSPGMFCGAVRFSLAPTRPLKLAPHSSAHPTSLITPLLPPPLPSLPVTAARGNERADTPSSLPPLPSLPLQLGGLSPGSYTRLSPRTIPSSADVSPLRGGFPPGTPVIWPPTAPLHLPGVSAHILLP